MESIFKHLEKFDFLKASLCLFVFMIFCKKSVFFLSVALYIQKIQIYHSIFSYCSIEIFSYFLIFAFINSDELDVLIFRSKRDFRFREQVTKSRLSNSRGHKVLIFLNTSNFLTKTIQFIFTQYLPKVTHVQFFPFLFPPHLDSCEIYFFSLIFIFIDE